MLSVTAAPQRRGHTTGWPTAAPLRGLARHGPNRAKLPCGRRTNGRGDGRSSSVPYSRKVAGP